MVGVLSALAATHRTTADELQRHLCHATSEMARRGEVGLGRRHGGRLVDVRLRTGAEKEAEAVQIVLLASAAARSSQRVCASSTVNSSASAPSTCSTPKLHPGWLSRWRSLSGLRVT